MKTIAFYLPQFHNIPENDKWWGDGYTEWIAVKRARPLFNDHYQPHEPLDDNYYNLLDKQTMQSQAKMMHEYGIDGMCFYHYYFESGKKVLEKPAENLLRWTDIDMPFCFSWANETWARSWSNIPNANAWNDVNSSVPEDKSDDGILLKQDYGTEIEWKEHFDYLLPFFCDERYIKVGGKPVFVFYKADIIPCLHKMTVKWEKWAQENRLPGIFFVGSNTKKSEMNAYVQQEANYSANYNGVRKDYEVITQDIINNAITADDNTFLCACPGYDDTPRRGNKGKVYTGSTPLNFGYQVKTLYRIAAERKHELFFVNAWNEWGEGMHLEPDKKNGYSYLEALKNAQMTYSTIDYNRIIKEFDYSEAIRKIQNDNYKMKELNRIMDTLLRMNNIESVIMKFFQKNEIKKFAIYGMGTIGDYLSKVFEKIGMPPTFCIDIDAERKSYSFLAYKPSDNYPEVDAIIVSTPTIFSEVYETLCMKNNTKNIYNIEELVSGQ